MTNQTAIMTRPATQLHVQVLAGPTQGVRTAFEHAPVAFGRERENDLVIGHPNVSRQHGQLHVDEKGRWVLVNLSVNGVRVGRKLVTKKPHRLHEGDEISVGDDPILRVHFQPITETAPAPVSNADEADGDESQTGKGKSGSGKTKLWVGIGVYMLLMLGLYIFFSTLDPASKKEAKFPPYLKSGQIAAQIREPLPKQGLNERLANEHLAAANQWYSQLDAKPAEALFSAHMEYKQALAHLEGDRLPDSQDQLRAIEVRDRLIDKVTNRYEAAYAKLRAGRHDEAREAFSRLMDFYKRPNTEIYQNWEAHLNTAIERAKRKRRGL